MPEHEDFLEKIFGIDWQTTALQMNKNNWVHECRTKAVVYLKTHKLPIHPNLTNKTKNNTDNNNNRYKNTQDSSSNQTQTNEDEQECTNETWPAPTTASRS